MSVIDLASRRKKTTTVSADPEPRPAVPKSGQPASKAKKKLAAKPRPPAPMVETAGLWSSFMSGRDSIDFDTDSVTLVEDDPDHPETNGTIVWSGASEIRMREICARFCFERIPFTLDELDALDRYLLHLVDAKALVGSQEAWVQPFMINSERKVTGKYIPAYLDGVMAFLNNDLEGLRQAHKGEAIWEGIVAHDREEKSLGR